MKTIMLAIIFMMIEVWSVPALAGDVPYECNYVAIQWVCDWMRQTQKQLDASRSRMNDLE